VYTPAEQGPSELKAIIRPNAERKNLEAVLLKAAKVGVVL
jgi:hypothetical protein